MTDLARARKLAQELVEALGVDEPEEPRTPKTVVDIVYEDDPNDPARTRATKLFSDGSTETTTLPKMVRGPVTRTEEP